MKKLALLSVIVVLCLPFTAQAQTPKLVSKHGDWASYVRTVGGDTICYVLTEPKSKSPSGVNHGDIYFMVASWKSGAAFEQPSFLAGYNLKANLPPKAIIGKKSFPMYAAENEGFIEESSQEKALVKAMRAGATMQVQAMSQRGTPVSYSFSLKGVTAALSKAKASCG